jgi:DNA modification methylase
MKIHNPNSLPVIDYRGLEPLQGNLKDLTEKNYDKLKRVLERRGFTVPVFIWKHDGVNYLMDGHGRQRVMLREQMNDDGNYAVPYILIEATDRRDAKAQLLEISSQYQTITQEGFDEFTDELENEDFEDVQFDALAFVGQGDDDQDTEEDEVPALDGVPPESKPGEIYQLGKHRLMCGDATDFGTVSDLMDGVEADLVFTDPPYGVDYEGKTDEKLTIQNDRSTETFVKALPNFITKPGAAYYICSPAGNNFNSFAQAFAEECYQSSTIIWLKNSMVMGHGDYHYRHEPILYGWNKEGPHKFYGDRKQTTVWEIDRPSVSIEHPTMKPVALPAKAIMNSSQVDEVVCDLFGGAGSTLIACEQLKRVCYMMELDAKYCDVIRKRYWKFVNGKEDGWQDNTPVVQSGHEPAATDSKPAGSQPDAPSPIQGPVVPAANDATVSSAEPGREHQPDPQQETNNPQTPA